jgi:hypothetical protein
MLRGLALVFVLILVMSNLMMLESALAQSMPKPSTPQFSLKVVNASEVSANYWVDPVGGQNMTVPSNYIVHYVIEMTIKNQPFVSYNYNGQNISLFYNVRMKESPMENWTTIYEASLRFPYQSNSDNTVLLFPIEDDSQNYAILSYYWASRDYDSPLRGISLSGAQVDFQADAMIGYVSRTIEFNSWHFTGQTSDWSNTQTAAIPVIFSDSLPTPTPSVPEFSWLAIMSLLAASFFVAIKLKQSKVNY